MKTNRPDTYSIVTSNTPGVMTRITGLIGRRGLELQSISAGCVNGGEQLRLTVRVRGEGRRIDQIGRQLEKVPETLSVTPIAGDRGIAHEMALVKIKAGGRQQREILDRVVRHHGRVLDAGRDGFIVELTGTPEHIDEFLAALPAAAVTDAARTGIVAMKRCQTDTKR